MKKTKITKIGIGFLFILSLFVSSVTACCCAHHQPQAEVELPACHKKEQKKSETRENDQKISLNLPCECIQETAPKISAKSDKLSEKQLVEANFSEIAPIKLLLTDTTLADFFRRTRFQTTDSHYNLKSPRAPPAA